MSVSYCGNVQRKRSRRTEWILNFELGGDDLTQWLVNAHSGLDMSLTGQSQIRTNLGYGDTRVLRPQPIDEFTDILPKLQTK